MKQPSDQSEVRPAELAHCNARAEFSGGNQPGNTGWFFVFSELSLALYLILALW
jgi:hypothetical protein